MSCCPSGQGCFSTDLGKMGLVGWTETPELRRTLDCLLRLVIRSRYSFDFEDGVFGVVYCIEGLTGLQCSKSGFSLKAIAAAASVPIALVQVFLESMLTHERETGGGKRIVTVAEYDCPQTGCHHPKFVSGLESLARLVHILWRWK